MSVLYYFLPSFHQTLIYFNHFPYALEGWGGVEVRLAVCLLCCYFSIPSRQKISFYYLNNERWRHVTSLNQRGTRQTFNSDNNTGGTSLDETAEDSPQDGN